MLIYDRIKLLAKMNNITIKKVSEDTGISVSTMKKWNFADPSIKGLLAIAHYFDTSVDFLIYNTTDIKSHKSDSTKIIEELENIQSVVGQRIATLKAQPTIPFFEDCE